MDRKVISRRRWLAGCCCWGEEGRDAGYWCLIWTGVALGAAILSCYHTDGYESSTLQGSTDISPLLHPCVLISIGFEWTRRGYERLLPLLIIDYWPASAESSVRSVYIIGPTVAPILLQIVCAVQSRAVRRQTHWAVLCFADVCWIALLKESLVIHGRFEEGALAPYGCRKQSFFFY